MTFLLVATLAALVVCAVMLRVADKQIAARDQRINELHIEVNSADRQAEDWQAKAEKLRADIERQVDIRIDLDNALASAERRALSAVREAVAARQDAHRCRARADRAEAALKRLETRA